MYPIINVPKVWIGAGSASRLVEEVARLGGRQIFLVTSPSPLRGGLVTPLVAALEGAGCTVRIYGEVGPEPAFADLDRLMDALAESPTDLVVGLGGGSVLDLAKLAAVLARNPGHASDYVGVDRVVNPGLPMIMLPTTAGTGSETTPNAILTNSEARLKQGIVSPHLMPQVAILDAELTLAVPPQMTAYTGMDALTHALESYVARRANPMSRLYSLEAARLIIRWLPVAVTDGQHLEARAAMLYASYLAGITITNAGTGAVHALAYPLGGEFGVPHGLANSLLMPHVFAVNARGLEPLYGDLAVALGWADPSDSPADAAAGLVTGLHRLNALVGVPASLREIGIPEGALPELARAAMGVTRLMQNNPRALTENEVYEGFRQAFTGWEIVPVS